MDIRHLPASNAGVSFSSTSSFFNYQYQSSILAIRILQRNLRYNQSKDVNHLEFSRRQNRRFPNYIKSSGGKDKFIFFTNILPMDIERIPFSISKDFERGSRNNLPKGTNVSFFLSHTTLNAVDNDPKTCWRPGRNVHRGEFFAIDFLYIRTNLSFSITVAHGQELQNSLDLNLSFDSVWWIAYRSFNGITIRNQNLTSNIQQYKIVFNSTEFNTGFHSFRYIAFNSSKLSPCGEFQVCDVETMAITIPAPLQ